MASATVIERSDKKPEKEGRGRRARPFLGVSRLGRTIIALNVAGLLILIIGALVLNETRRALVQTNLDSLQAEAETIASIAAEVVTFGDPEPVLDVGLTQSFVRLVPLPKSQRLRVFDAQGNLVADSFFESGAIEQRELPPLRRPGGVFQTGRDSVGAGSKADVERAIRALDAEARIALSGQTAAAPRPTASGERVLSVSVPIRRVQAVTGVLTIEAGDVGEIIRRQRAALTPFVIMAVLATVASSVLLSIFIATPVRRLARAADDVRLSQARAISLPDISRRDDELGDLARSLETMTHTLSERMDAIERFAADVAHEIRNPITSIRSAVETLDLVKNDEAAREKLLGILKQDTSRLDRLITDISNASRLDAELSRDHPKSVELDKLALDIVHLYPDGPNDTAVVLLLNGGPYYVTGREGPLGQVLRNLIDNARSFTGQTDKMGASVRVTMRRQNGEVITEVDDDGPGIPPENLETVFDRFYTSRPQKRHASPTGNSGLGLSIARQITDAHNGRIWAENRVGANGEIEGARFIFALPSVSR